MNEREKDKIRIATRVIATGTIHDSDYNELGYDPYKFSYYGKPSDSDVKEKCARILSDAIIALMESKEID